MKNKLNLLTEQSKKTGKMRLTGFNILIFLLLSASTLLANARFDATTNRNKVGLNQTVQVTYTLTDAEAGSFQPPQFEGFTVLSGPNRSSSMQIINNQMSRSTGFSFLLRPVSTGTFTFPPARIQADGEWKESNPVTIEVIEGDAQDPARQQEQDPMAQVPDNLYLRLYVDKKEAYVGEQITATFKLYNRLNINNTRIRNMPEYNGFWAEEIELGGHDVQIEVINGVRFETVVVNQVALYPQRSGKLRIEPMELSTNVRIQVPGQRRGFFDSPFSSSRTVPYDFKSNAGEIEVKPLPSTGRPANFTGMVGRFEIEASVDRETIDLNDAITYSIKLSGSGNWQNVSAPKPEFSRDFEVFEPKVNRNISFRRGRLSGHIQYDYLIIPSRPGNFRIPSLSWAYFDPAAEKYVELKTREITLNVEGEDTGRPITGTDRREIEMLSRDIRYIQTELPDFNSSPTLRTQSAAYLSLYFSPVLLLLLALLFRNKLNEKRLNPIGWRQKNAFSLFKKELQKFKNETGQSSNEMATGELIRIIGRYVGDKTSSGHAIMEKDVIHQKLEKAGLSDELIQALVDLLEEIEMSVYAPAGKRDAMQHLIDKAEKTVKDIDSNSKE